MAAACAVLTATAASAPAATATAPNPVAAAASPVTATAPSPVTAAAPSLVGRDVADPVRLRIPAIGLSTPVIPLRLNARGKLIAPKRFDRVGWNRSGPEPGELGVAVIAGHVDSKKGPAVFYRLRDLRAGDRVHVDRADGTTVTFRITRLARYPKSRIPDRQVYGSGKGTQLRLITCGGPFDRGRRSYRDNVVAFAR
ncbi:class F sortase [Nonomuraea sp. NN258]|nr:class F sortase [Nonomuraea antri]